jgi:hypothetical protein
MYAIVHANAEILEETIKMRTKRKSLDQVLQDTGYTAMWEARGIAIGEARGVTIGEAKGEAREREKWQIVVADKDAEIVRLRKQLEKIKK